MVTVRRELYLYNIRDYLSNRLEYSKVEKTIITLYRIQVGLHSF